MDPGTKERVDGLLANGFAARSLSDSREEYRNLLRDLRVRDPAAYEKAARHYSSRVLSGIAAGEDALEMWIDYGGFIGSLTETGTLMSIDATGRSAPYGVPFRDGDMVLFVPERGRNGAFVVVAPLEPSPAQSATVGLLVEGWLALKQS
jgi:hypothetical protein